LAKKQSLELVATAILGKGKTHIKFSPGLIYYRGYPVFNAKDKTKLKRIEEELKNIITIKGENIQVNDFLRWNEHCEEVLEINDVEVKNSNENFIFFVESWGQLKPEEIVKKALNIFDEKLDEFSDKLKKAK
jgi:DNA-directed RNA polymerase alpha subunit